MINPFGASSSTSSVKLQRLFRLFDALGRPTPEELTELTSSEHPEDHIKQPHQPSKLQQERWSEFAQELFAGPAAAQPSLGADEQEMRLAYRPQKMAKQADQTMINVPSGIEFVEDRINQALRAAGEAEIKLPIIEYMDDSCSPPVSVYD